MGRKRNPDEGELIPGTLDMMILKTVSRGEHHGYAIVQSIQEASGSVLRVEEGALYPGLHRLEVRGWLRSRWGTSENNRRAKFYRLTAAGRRRLKSDTASWNRLATAMAAALETRAGEVT